MARAGVRRHHVGPGGALENIPSYRPLAFAPPYGNYGQDGTNNPRIPEELLPWLVDRFGIVFTQDQSFFTTPRQPQPLGRLQLTRDMTGGELHEWLTERGRSSGSSRAELIAGNVPDHPGLGRAAKQRGQL